MAFTLVGPLWVPDLTVRANNFNDRVMDANGEYVAWVIQVPKSGTLKNFEFHIGAVGNNPDNGLRLSFQDVDLATGLPDGVADQFVDITGVISTGWQVPGEMTDDGTGTGVPRTVTVGDLLACRVDFVSFTASDSVSIRAEVANSQAMSNTVFPYPVLNGIMLSELCNIALRYDDDSVVAINGCLPATSFAETVYHSGTTPDEYALRFQLGVPMRAVGAWGYFDLNGNAELVLYDSGGSTLATATMDPQVQTLSAIRNHFQYFDAAVELDAATTYYLSLKPTDTTGVTLVRFTVNTADLLGAWSGGAEMYEATRTDAGAWTPTTTNRPILGLVCDAVDAAGAGGGASAYGYA
jgi:hypothetical protein